MKGVAADLRHALRIYRQTPLATAVAVLALALSMAFVSAFLAFWSDLALTPLHGFDRSAGIVTIDATNGEITMGVSLNLVESLNKEASSVETAVGVQSARQFLEEKGQKPVGTELVTRGFFSALAPRMALGRGFEDADHVAGAEPVAVISYDFWQRQFDGDPGVLGKRLTVHGPQFILISPKGRTDPSQLNQPYRIVGVMARRVDGVLGSGVDLWMPYEQAEAVFMAGAGPDVYRTLSSLRGLVRPRAGTAPRAVLAELESRRPAAGQSIPPGWHFEAEPGAVQNIRAHRDTLKQVRLFTAASVLVVLVAACTLSLFLMSRAPGRQRELAIRMSVGAPFRRLARQLASEAAVLVFGGTVLGVLASVWLTVALRGLPFFARPVWHSASPIDWRVLVAVAAIALLLTGLVSLAPIAGLRRLGLAAGARAVAARAGWGQRIAGAAQVALAALMGAVAVSFGWHLLRLVTADHGFDATDVYLVNRNLPRDANPFNTNTDAVLVEREQRRAVVESLPGVSDVAFGSVFPGRNFGASQPVRLPGATDRETVNADLVSADQRYFDVLGIEIRRGRSLEPTDREGAIVNETLARRLWGTTDVVGRVVETPGLGGYTSATVIGVAADAVFGHPAAEPRPMLFRLTMAFSEMDPILVKGRLSAAALHDALQKKIDDGELSIQIGNVQPVEELWSRQLAPDRARAALTAAAAALVVLLAAFGFYGMQRYLVTAGRREYAIRAAVGAGPKALGRLVVRRGFGLAAPGLVLGGLLGFLAAAWLRDDFVARAVSPAVVALLVVLAAGGLVAAAGAGPARQARRMKPAPVLKEE